MKTSTRFLFCCLMLGCSFLGFAQKKNKPASENLVQPYRYEIAMSESDEDFTVLSAQESGLILFRQANKKPVNNYQKWEVVKLDTALRQQWRREYNLDRNFIIRGYEYSEQKLYLLFQKGQYRSFDNQFVVVDLLTQDTTMHNFSSALPIELTEFFVKNNVAVFGGIVNGRSVVVLFDFATNKQQVVPGFYNPKSEILQIKIDQYDSAFDVLLTERSPNQFTLATKTYSVNGELLQNIILNPTEGNHLIWGSTTAFENDARLIAGTYSNKPSAYSRGIFIAKIDRKGEQRFIFVNYSELDNFFNYMRAKRKERVLERIERKKVQGKTARLSYRLVVHDIIKDDDQYIMIAEAYYPVYTSPTNVGFSGYGVNNNFIFDGYRYTHAVLIGFDANGKILWDNSFEINDVKSYTLRKFVQVAVDDDRIVLLYIFDNVIRTKIVSGKTVVEGKTFNPVALKFDYDRVRNNSSEVSRLDHWYQNAFVAYGVQKIKNINATDDMIYRKVFYINKIEYK